jgi:hypothetical protein
MTTTSRIKRPRINIQKFLLYSLIFFLSYLIHYHIPGLSHYLFQGQDSSVHFAKHQTIIALLYHLYLENPKMIPQCSFCKTSNNPCLVVSSISRKPKNDSSMQSEEVSTYLMIKDICSW